MLRRHRPSRRELAAPERVLDAVPWSRKLLLYARVDLISDGDRDPILMELELTEPQLYFHEVPTAAERAAAIIEAHARRRQARFSRSFSLTAIARRNDGNTSTRSVRRARGVRAASDRRASTAAQRCQDAADPVLAPPPRRTARSPSGGG
jgi:hypothetical protein